MIPLDEYNISKIKTFFIIAWKRSPFWKSDLFKRVVPVWEGEGGLTLNACPDGLGHFFVDVQMGNFLSKGGVRTLARMVCALFRSARTSYRAFDFRPVRPPLRNNPNSDENTNTKTNTETNKRKTNDSYDVIYFWKGDDKRILNMICHRQGL